MATLGDTDREEEQFQFVKNREGKTTAFVAGRLALRGLLRLQTERDEPSSNKKPIWIQ